MFIEMNPSNGGGGGGGAFTEMVSDYTTSSSKSLSDLVVGKHYLILAFASAGANMSYNRFDGCTASGGTLTKLGNLTNQSRPDVGTFFDFEATATSATITYPYNGFLKVYEQ